MLSVMVLQYVPSIIINGRGQGRRKHGGSGVSCPQGTGSAGAALYPIENLILRA